MFPSGHYVSNQGFIIKTHGTTITGQRAAYSYSPNAYGTEIAFTGGTTGFDFCMGLATADPNYFSRFFVFQQV